MRHKIYKTLAAAVSASMLFSVCMPVNAASNEAQISEEYVEAEEFFQDTQKNVWGGEIKDHNRFYLDDNGEKIVGLQKIDEKTYFFNEEGFVQTGWKEVGEVEYYFSLETGERYENRIEEIDGVKYSFNKDGEYSVVEEEVSTEETTPEDDRAEVMEDSIVEYAQKGWTDTEAGKQYLDATGNPLKGMQTIDGKPYFFDMETGLLQKGWISFNGNRYFAAQTGIIYQNQLITFGSTAYYMGADGSAQKGYIKAKNGKLYFGDLETGILKKSCWIEHENKKYFASDKRDLYMNQFISFGKTRYYMGADGSVQKGIIQTPNGVYYADPETGMIQQRKAGWIEKDGKKYFMSDKGTFYSNQIITFGKTWYYLGKDGSVQKGYIKASNGTLYYGDPETGILKKSCWIESDNKKYFANANGALYKNQLISFGKVSYYMGKDGSVQTGVVNVSGTYYYAQSNGMIEKTAGWIEDNNHKYFAAAGGKLYRNQFISFGKNYYYCGNDAAIVTGTQVIDGVQYEFDTTGLLKKEGGWGEYNGNKYYKDPTTGMPYRNQFVTFGKTWYYANAKGIMVSGWQTIKGYRYYFYPETKIMARNTTIDGIKIGADGRASFYSDRIAVFTTVSTNNANGTYNMKKALSSFNQVVIQPGQTLSFFGVAGPCGKAEGYLPAGVVGGIGYGGGICQASTTLYGAALRAGLTIVERRNHSVPSTYVPIGQDAMVDYGSSDLKIKNNYDFPVKLVTYSSGNTLYAEVWGMQPSWFDSVKIESWYTGSNSAVAYRKYMKNGNVVRTEQLPSSYYY